MENETVLQLSISCEKWIKVLSSWKVWSSELLSYGNVSITSYSMWKLDQAFLSEFNHPYLYIKEAFHLHKGN